MFVTVSQVHGNTNNYGLHLYGCSNSVIYSHYDIKIFDTKKVEFNYIT